MFLAKLYLRRFKDKELAWKTLIALFNETKLNVIQYELGKLAVEQNYNLNKGISFLLNFINQRSPVLPDSYYSISDAYLLIAKAYYNKKNKTDAADYLQKSITANPDNENALKWKKEVRL